MKLSIGRFADHLFWALLLTAAILVPGCSGAGDEAPPAESSAPEPEAALADDIVLAVGDVQLSRDTFEAIWQAVGPEIQQRYGADGRLGLLDEFTARLLWVAEAKRLELDQKPEVASRLVLAQSDLLYDHAVDHVLRAQIPEAAARGFHTQRGAEFFSLPERLVVRVMVVTSSRDEKLTNTERDDATDEESARRKIEFLHGRVVAGDDFGELVRRFGEHPASPEGGLLEPAPIDGMPEEFRGALQGLADGELSAPLGFERGFYFVRIEGRRPAGVPPYEEIEDDIKRAMLRETRETIPALIQKSLAELRDRYPVERFPERLTSGQ